MTLNRAMAVRLRYFAEFGKPAFQHIGLTASTCGGIYARVYCILQCVYDVVVKKFTFAISSPICFTDRTTTHTSGNSSIDTSLIRDIYCGPKVLFETCVAMKFVDDDDDDGEFLVNVQEFDRS